MGRGQGEVGEETTPAPANLRKVPGGVRKSSEIDPEMAARIQELSERRNFGAESRGGKAGRGGKSNGVFGGSSFRQQHSPRGR